MTIFYFNIFENEINKTYYAELVIKNIYIFSFLFNVDNSCAATFFCGNYYIAGFSDEENIHYTVCHF